MTVGEAYSLIADVRERKCVDCGHRGELFGPKRNRCWPHFRTHHANARDDDETPVLTPKGKK